MSPACVFQLFRGTAVGILLASAGPSILAICLAWVYVMSVALPVEREHIDVCCQDKAAGDDEAMFVCGVASCKRAY